VNASSASGSENLDAGGVDRPPLGRNRFPLALGDTDASQDLTPDPESARAARRFVDRTLAGWDGPEARDDAVLLVDELVTNAIRHARTPVDLALEVGDDALYVEVYDADPALPVLRNPGPTQTSGRGLPTVAALADVWGVRPEPVGKVVWFQLAASRVGADD